MAHAQKRVLGLVVDVKGNIFMTYAQRDRIVNIWNVTNAELINKFNTSAYNSNDELGV